MHLLQIEQFLKCARAEGFEIPFDIQFLLLFHPHFLPHYPTRVNVLDFVVRRV